MWCCRRGVGVSFFFFTFSFFPAYLVLDDVADEAAGHAHGEGEAAVRDRVRERETPAVLGGLGDALEQRDDFRDAVWYTEVRHLRREAGVVAVGLDVAEDAVLVVELARGPGHGPGARPRRRRQRAVLVEVAQGILQRLKHVTKEAVVRHAVFLFAAFVWVRTRLNTRCALFLLITHCCGESRALCARPRAGASRSSRTAARRAACAAWCAAPRGSFPWRPGCTWRSS